MRSAFLSVLYLLLIVGLRIPIAAAEQDERLSGLSGKEVERRFGPPDERRSGQEGKESWLYGKSVILFRNGKVTAWSNAGEMSGRENLATVRSGEDDEESSRYLWQNPWTPQEGPNAKKVLEDLFLRLERDSGNDLPPEGKSTTKIESKTEGDEEVKSKS